MAVTANGWPLKDTGLATFVAPNGHVTSVASRDLAILFAYLVYRWDTELEPVTACYGNRTRAEQRKVNPASMDSNHISATAIDVNGAKHPYEHTAGSAWTSGFSTAGLAKLREILAATGVLQSGLDFTHGYRDAMHVQVRESLSDRYSRPVSAADVAAAAQRVGDWAANVQTAVGVTPDRIMGPGTKQAVRAFQSKHGLTVDGIWGPASQAAADKGSSPTPAPTPTPTLTGDAATLAKGGITANQQNIVDAAAKVGLPLSIAAAFVEQESHGANVYGHDAGGAMSGAGQVTQTNYKTFLSMVRGGHTSNGVGPLQLTYPGYFEPVTDEVAGLWQPLNNLVFGLRIIKASLGGNYSDTALDAAGQRYNSGRADGAPDYGKAIVAKVHRWRQLLGDLDPITPTPPKVTATGHADTGQDLNAWLSDADVAATQRILGVTPDKLAGPDTINALEVKAGVKPDGWLDPKGSLTIKKVQARFIQQLGVHLAIDGVIGKDTAAAWHAYLVSGKFTNLAHQSLNVTSFPYPRGTAYAVNDGTDHTKSGVAAKDRDAIKRIQTRLRALGHPIAVDGRYGPATRAAVITEQRKHHISADGQVGFNTWAALGL